LVDNDVSFATAVIITSYPSALQVGISAPFDALANATTPSSNKFVVLSGVIIGYDAEYSGDNYRLLLSGPGGLNVLRTVVPSAQVASEHLTTVAVTETPLPAALPLFATGLGALSLFGWLRKKKAPALAA
jgi:hypothetical protein